MEQAKTFACPSCASGIPLGHKFCGRCGASAPVEVAGGKVAYYGTLQTPGRARVVMLRGEGVEGLSYQLNAEHHVLGRAGQIAFANDAFVSPKHADLYYRDGVLYVKDEGSLNGVYVRLQAPRALEFGDTFLIGDHVFRLDVVTEGAEAPDAHGTFASISPSVPALFRVSQLLEGGGIGISVRAVSGAVRIGREGMEMNFPCDAHLSPLHCTVQERAGKVWLTDGDSRNGTYVRIRNETALQHGDCLFVGKQLLRVEITS